MLARLTALITTTIAAATCAGQGLGPENIGNTGFESNAFGWFGFGAASVSRTTDVSNSGDFGLRVDGRTSTFNGPATVLPNALPEAVYQLSVWVRVDQAGTHRVQATIKHTDAGGDSFRQAADQFVQGQQWSLLQGTYTLDIEGSTSELLLYIEGPAAGVSYVIDDASFREVQVGGNWEDAANQRIEQLRKGDARIIVRDASGQPIDGAVVNATQTSKSFPFGSVISQQGLGNQTYLDFFAEHFNYAVAENAMKWYSTHPFPGANFYANADALLAFCQANGIPMRGHTVFWAPSQWPPDWVQNLFGDDLRNAVYERIEQIVGRYAGQLTHWDVNNEMVHGDFYASRLGDGIRVEMFQRVKSRDPNALTFVNDYNIITANDTDEYINQIIQLQNDGAPIDAIGVQGHFSGSVNPESVLLKLNQLAALGKPIWVTEFDIDTPNLTARANGVEDLYRAAYSHPSVDGIIMWGFWEGTHWRDNSHLVDLDWTVNAAGERYFQIMDEWTTQATGSTAADGAWEFRGFHGDYDIEVEVNGQIYASQLTLNPDATGVTEIIVETPGNECVADTNGDGVLSPADFNAWILAFNSSAPACDQNGDGVCSPADFNAWILAYNAGCD